ncbi:squalene/phytoene synthase family protein [Halomicroarcula sp. GCM10025894]|uniref:squalene/phytoene synthase family protein n=1 Tax=Halomicroarcula sp. GCM10025894 TaxID=3252673 RepID=UPI003611BD5F
MSQNHTGRPSQEDIEWCYDAVHRVSRTFSLTISELDEPMARDICVGYLLCRVADTIEDAGHIPRCPVRAPPTVQPDPRPGRRRVRQNVRRRRRRVAAGDADRRLGGRRQRRPRRRRLPLAR